MKPEYFKAEQIKLNPNNPRLIKDDKFKKLVKSIQDFPEMMELRPIVVDENMVILGGNMRFRAMQEAGVKLFPVIVAKNLTEEQKQEFIIKDNVSFGEWDWDLIANEFDAEQLKDWGLEVWTQPDETDYSILESGEVDSQVESMSNGVKRGILIEFEAEHFEEAYELIKFWREQKLYIGGFLLEKLKDERSKSK